jgi:dihydrofolate synthase/folylpolyglutamate synthase
MRTRAAVEAFHGDQQLAADLVREAFGRATSPGRLEIIRRSPMIILDAAHNPHGAEATAAALDDSFAFSPLIGVIGVMSDKDAEGVLAAFEPHLAQLVVTQNSTWRALPAEELAVTAREVFGDDRVTVARRLEDAIDEATTLAEAGEAVGSSIGSGAVLITGSVVTVGEARAMLRRRERRAEQEGAGG